MPYVCDNHPDRPGVLLVTNLENGDTQTVCADDVHTLALAIADATAPEGAAVRVISDAMVAQLAAAEAVVSPEPDSPASGSDDGPDDDPEARGFSDATVAAALADESEQGDAAARDDAGAPAPESVSL